MRLFKVIHLGALLLASLLGRTAGGSDDFLPLFREDFETGIGSHWDEWGFSKVPPNVFSLATEPGGNRYLKVDSAASSSAKVVYLAFPPDYCPEVSWRWKVSRTIESADLSRKEGDDAAARVYVIFGGSSSLDPLDKRILVYVWDSGLPVGRSLANPWLPELERMIVLRNGGDPIHEWVTERVSLPADFARVFPDEALGGVEGLAFVADTDNTSGRVSAGFDDLVVRCLVPGEDELR